jgi:hypothetical protein
MGDDALYVGKSKEELERVGSMPLSGGIVRTQFPPVLELGAVLELPLDGEGLRAAFPNALGPC